MMNNFFQKIKTKNPWNNPKDIILVILGIVFVLFLVFFADFSKNTNSINFLKKSETIKCPISLIGGERGNERIYLARGAIFAIKDDSKKIYYILECPSYHVTQKQLLNLQCFETTQDAKLAGYTKGITVECSFINRGDQK